MLDAKPIVEPSRLAPWLTSFAGVTLAHVAQVVFLLWVATHAKYCCDASDYYIPAGRAIFHDGLLWQDPYAGYRFYFVPMIFGALQKMLGLSAADAPARLPFALAAIFCFVSILTSFHVVRRNGMRRWLAYGVPLLFNPFLLAVVPYPLQESVVIIFCIPLLVVLLASEQRDYRKTCVIAALFCGIAFIARSSLLWTLLPALLFVGYEARRVRPGKSHILQGVALASLIWIVLIAPQSYISWHKFGTVFPLAKIAVGYDQFAYGVEFLNYTTIFDDGGFGPFPVLSPYSDLPAAEKTPAFYFNHPAEGAFLVLAHVWSGLNYVALTPYVAETDLTIVTPWLILSSIVVAYGILGLPLLFARREEGGAALLLITLALLCCAYTAFAGTESRFGLLGFAALSVSMWRLVSNRANLPLCLQALPLAVAYVGMSTAFNALLLYRTPVPWPHVGESRPIQSVEPHVSFSTGANSGRHDSEARSARIARTAAFIDHTELVA